MPSLCYLLASTDMWGGVKIVFEQAEQLAARGFDVTIASLDEGPDWYDLQVPLVTAPDFGGRNLPPADCYIGTFWTTVAAAHDTGLGIGAHLIQGYEGALAPSEDQRRRIDFVYGLKTVKLAVSPHLAATVRSKFGESCRTVRNGIDGALFHDRGRSEAGGRVRVAVPGPFEIDCKGIPVALGALAQLRREGRPFEIVRISSAPQTERERALCPADEYHHRIPAEEVAEVLRSCQIVVSASTDAEGFGLPPMEALACGCAAVLSDIPAYRDFGAAVGGWDEYCSFVVPGDTDGFAGAIRDLVDDDARRAALVESGTALGRRYTWDEVGPELAQEMTSMLDAERERWAVRNERMVPGESDLLTEKMHEQRYEFARRYASGRRALDAGCGVGYGSFAMAESGAVSVKALDYSEAALAYARERYPHPAIEWTYGDLFSIPWGADSADLVTCFEVFEHVERPDELVSRLSACLSDEGLALISTPNRTVYSPEGEPQYVHHIREYEIDEFDAILRAYFDGVEIHGQRLEPGGLAIGSPQPTVDMTYVSVCSSPRVPRATERFELLSTLDTDSGVEEWRPLLRAWCETFRPEDPATLVLVAGDVASAEGRILAALAEWGLDPEAIPDVLVEASTNPLVHWARNLPAASAAVPLGVDASRQRRLADCFGVVTVDDPAPARLSELASAWRAGAGAGVAVSAG
jgi:glycosyltransferase involved in cell wall biosynthesis/SAM-dependent methyltransferase